MAPNTKSPMPAQILMCPPDYYGIEYEINPWMSRTRQANSALAVEQWQSLHRLLEECGAKISLIEPVKGLPDMVFTANAALIFRDTAVLSRFHHPRAAGRNAAWRALVVRAGHENPPALQRRVFRRRRRRALLRRHVVRRLSHPQRRPRAHNEIAEMLECRVIPLELVNSYFYHLDTCFCPFARASPSIIPRRSTTMGKKH